MVEVKGGKGGRFGGAGRPSGDEGFGGGGRVREGQSGRKKGEGDGV